MANIAIIGAGVSGLAAAFELERTGANVRVFEKSRGYSGRAASRTRNGCRYDYGANYFKVSSNEVAHLLFDQLPTENLCRIRGDIGTFDEEGNLSPGDPEHNARSKWSYRDGISTIGKLLVRIGGIEVTRETRIASMQHSNGQWILTDADGESHGLFDSVLLTAPAPQTNELLATVAPREEVAPLIKALGKASYFSQFCVVLNYAGRHFLPDEHYALINTDRQHDLAWLSHENQKSGHVPDDETLLIAQMSPDWSEEHFEEDPAAVSRAAARTVDDLLPGLLPEPQWTDMQRWKFAHPHSRADEETLERGRDLGLFFAGDALVGKGRLPRAIETGLRAARRMQEQFCR